MAVAPTFIGEFRKGDTLVYPVEFFNDTPAWEPNFFDVYDNDGQILALGNQSVIEGTDTPVGVKFVSFQLADMFDTDSDRSFTWIEGKTYSIIVKEAVGSAPTDNPNSFILVFKVATSLPQAAFIGFVENRKNFYFTIKEENRSNLWYDLIDPKSMTLILGNVAMSGPVQPFGGNRLFSHSIDTDANSLVIGRTYWIRVKDLAVADPNLDVMYSFTVIPELEFELKRLLALGGENLVLDNFAYDQAGNIIGLRTRGFETSSDADAATIGVTDPEPGELFSLNVDQEHDVARNVRTFHKSVREFLTTLFPSDP